MPFLKRLFRFTSRTRAEIDADVRDEIAFHFEMRARELAERGWSLDAARAEARRQFGDLAETATYCRTLDEDKEMRMRLRLRADDLRQDLTYGARTMFRQPGLSLVAILTVALGIGATTLVFSVVYASLLAPLPFPHPARLMVVRVSLPDYADLRASVGAFESSGVYGSNLYTIDDEDEQVLGSVASPGIFTTLGVTPLLGRAIEERDGVAPVVVLGNGLWKRRFGADPQVVGRTIRLSGRAHTIIGVMPERFLLESRAYQLWTNIDAAMVAVPQQTRNRSLRIFRAIGRLKPDVTAQQAQAELSALATRLEATHPSTNAGVALTLVSVHERLVGDVRTALLVALGSVGCLLFIACINVANLTLARLTTRAQELAVRAALGAGMLRIARQLVTESLLTAAAGGAVGVLLARWGLLALPGLIGDRVPRASEIALNLPVLAAAVAAVVVAGLFVAAVPIVHLRVAGIEPALRGSARGDGDLRFGARLRSALVVAQIGIAVVVLAGALVLTRSLVRLLDADPGFAADRLLTFNLPLLAAEPTLAAGSAAAGRTLEAIAALPGIAAVGGATGLAPVTAQRSTTFDVEGRSDAPADERRAYFIAASPGYFHALGTRLLAGREFAAGDAAAAPLVAIISETLARRSFPNGDAVGRRLRLLNPEYPDAWRTIVGVVADVRYQGLDDSTPPVLYTPFAQTPFPWIYVHVRTKGDPGAAIGPIRAAVKSVSPSLKAASPRLMTDLVTESSADPRFSTTLISLFAVLAVLLATIGLHGVVSFGVARRTREIAIRLALGASVGSVRWRVIRQALVLALVGAGVGLVGAVSMGSLISGLLYETTPTDPLALSAVAMLLVVVAAIASALPARRATRIAPVDALRES